MIQVANRENWIRKCGWILLFVLLTICLLGMQGCSSKEENTEGGTKVYYVSSTETKLETRSYELEGTTLEENVHELLELLAKPSEKLDYKPPLGYGFTVVSTEIQNDTLTLDVDSPYNELSSCTEVLVRAALVKTFTQLEGIGYVYMRVDGQPLLNSKGEPINRMNSNQFIYNDGNDINTYELKKIKLYFANASGDSLTPIFREKHYSTNVLLERFIVEELILGPGNNPEGPFATINPDTKILGVTTKDGVCYVNLDAGFLTVVNNVPTETAIYSIVNSLTEVGNVNQVQIQINGEVPETFQMSVYERNLDYVEKTN